MALAILGIILQLCVNPFKYWFVGATFGHTGYVVGGGYSSTTLGTSKDGAGIYNASSGVGEYKAPKTSNANESELAESTENSRLL